MLSTFEQITSDISKELETILKDPEAYSKTITETDEELRKDLQKVSAKLSVLRVKLEALRIQRELEVFQSMLEADKKTLRY